MNQTKAKCFIVQKTVYEDPKIDLIPLSCADIITTSVTGDKNQGEWDPQ